MSKTLIWCLAILFVVLIVGYFVYDKYYGKDATNTTAIAPKTTTMTVLPNSTGQRMLMVKLRDGSTVSVPVDQRACPQGSYKLNGNCLNVHTGDWIGYAK